MTKAPRETKGIKAKIYCLLLYSISAASASPHNTTTRRRKCVRLEEAVQFHHNTASLSETQHSYTVHVESMSGSRSKTLPNNFNYWHRQWDEYQWAEKFFKFDSLSFNYKNFNVHNAMQCQSGISVTSTSVFEKLWGKKGTGNSSKCENVWKRICICV